MARLRTSRSVASSRADSVANSLYRDPSIPPPHQPTPSANTPRAIASPGSSSDKENRTSKSTSKLASMPPSNAQNSRGPKRRRLGDRDGTIQYESPSSGSEASDDSDDVQVVQLRPEGPTAKGKAQDKQDRGQYDPHQPMIERRQLRKNMREHNKELHDQRNELSVPSSRGLETMIRKQNVYFEKVKQTSDATIDSRFLVDAGEITYKRTKTLNVGDNAQIVDVEEFIGKCISFMKDGAERNVGATQQRRRAAAVGDDDEEDLDQGDALDWSFFGAQACLPVNVRPPVMGFLLGPLSVQKRARAPRARRERLARAGPVEAVQAKELRAEELGKSETSSLTSMCKKILDQFHSAHNEGLSVATQYWDRDEDQEPEEAELALFKERNVLMDDGGLSLFKFVINPRDFGQTVENIFYLSFLVRDDFIQIKFDENGLPSLHAVDADTKADEKRRKGPKHQAILALDYQTWEQLVELNDIKRPLIPHRASDSATNQVSNTGWYG